MDLLRKVMEIFSAGQIRKKTGQSNTLSFFAGSFQLLIFEQCKLLKPGSGAPPYLMPLLFKKSLIRDAASVCFSSSTKCPPFNKLICASFISFLKASAPG